MRWNRFGLGLRAVIVVLLAAVSEVTTASPGLHLPRQDVSLSTQSSLPAASSTPGPAPSNGVSSASLSPGSAIETNSSSTLATSTIISSRIHSSLTTSASPSFTPPPGLNLTVPQNTSADDETLPITPAITAALSVAGVILILSGAIYALIGIKNQWVQIFLSIAYLTSLSITVLIVYVMNTPVSNGVQAAYFVAVLIPGLIVGGGALVFKDLTEGLGCIVGGFSLSMWILVLKDGGVIPSTAGKAIFIGVLCAVFLGLSFSRTTRAYTLIASTSIGGATAIVLGVDCFSRAGLKEFWLYIWNLNDNLFPLLTVTYPITRGMRVEIVAIVVLTLIGVLSQFRIWKVIQDRRAREALAGQEKERQRDLAEEEIGRKLVAGTGREQERWEATYGEQTSSDRQHKDSGFGTRENSVRKFSMTHGEPRTSMGSGGYTVEMNNLGSSSRPSSIKFDKSSGGPSVSVSAAQADTVQQRSPQTYARLSNQNINPSGSRMSSVDITTNNGSTEYSNYHESYAVGGTPQLGQLAFESGTSYTREVGDTANVATAASSYRPPRMSLQRFSGSSLMKTISSRSKRHSRQNSTFVEPPETVSSRDDETALISPENVSGSTAKPSRHIRENSIGLSIRPEDVLVSESPVSPLDPSPGEDEQTNVHRSLDETSRRLAAEYGEESGGLNHKGGSSLEESSQQAKSLLGPLSEVPEETENNTLSRDLSEMSIGTPAEQHFGTSLPEATSKAVSVFRTKEWAKHLDRADVPETDRLSMLKPSDSMESESSEEAAAPVDIDALQQVATEISPPSASLSSADSLANLPRSPSNISRNFLSEYMASQPISTKPSRDSLKRKPVSSLSRQSSQQSDLSIRPVSLSAHKPKGVRSSSSPIVESPIEEGVEKTTFPTRYVSSPNASTTLLAQRNTMLQNKHLSPSTSRSTSYNSGFPISSSDLTSPATYHPSNPLEDDSMSLAQRRSLLQSNPQSRLPSTSYIPDRQSTYPPLLDSSARRASMLSAWRSSIQHDLSHPSTPTHETELRRANMLDEKQRERVAKAQGVQRQRSRDLQWDQAMRRTDMQDAHREVLRRMQRGVNESLRSDTA